MKLIWFERLVVVQEVVGSSPTIHPNDPLDKRLSRLPFTQKNTGSNPVRVTMVCSSIGQDAGFSRQQGGFDSRTDYTFNFFLFIFACVMKFLSLSSLYLSSSKEGRMPVA